MMRISTIFRSRYRHHAIGRKAERSAKKFLIKRGFLILETNWTSKFGEIDIIAADCGTLVIVEVKCRHESIRDAFSPSDAIDDEKIRRLHALAAEYLASAPRRIAMMDVRFDAILMQYKAQLIPPRIQFKIEHEKSSFEYER